MNAWEIVKDLFIVVVTIGGSIMGSTITKWLERIHDKLEKLNESTIRHDEHIDTIKDTLTSHHERITKLENK